MKSDLKDFLQTFAAEGKVGVRPTQRCMLGAAGSPIQCLIHVMTRGVSSDRW